MNKRTATESKESILNTAIEVFSEMGYSKATVRDVAKQAGISVGGVYIYFRNKEELYRTILKYILDDFMHKQNEALKDIKDPLEAINIFVKINLNNIKKNRSFIIIEGREHGFTFGTNIMKKKFFKNQLGLIKDIIKKGITAGKFKECDVNEAARVIISILRGVGLSMIVNSKTHFSAGACCSLIINGLLRRDLK